MSRRRAILVASTALLGGLALPGTAAATLVPIGTGTYDVPTYVTSPPGEPDRLIVTEQGGMVWQTTPSGTTPYLDLTQETDARGEEGLWSLAFAPDFRQSGRFYAAYSAGDRAPQVVEFREGPTPAATEATARRVLKVEDNPITSNHNGGQLQFGPDGMLYWSVGDDAANPALAQDLGSLRGKLLRIDPRGSVADEYTVPPDNPFAGTIPGRDEIWALGLRNPWRFSFDRLTGAIAIGDVGAGTREEVDYMTQAAGAARGANFGWPACEGRFGTECSTPGFVAPVYDYTNPSAGPAAIAGGYVVRDPDLGDLYGRYLFADTYEGRLRSIDPAESTPTDAHRTEDLAAGFITSFGEDSCGRLYVVSRGAGQVFRLQGPAGGACPSSPPPPAADVTPPETKLRMRKVRRRAKRVFDFSSSEPNSTFECKRDRKRWRACKSPKRLRRLSKGRHRLRVRAIDAAGNVDPTPARKRFKVKPRRRR